MQTEKKIIEIRTCVVCRERKHKSDFIRIVKSLDGTINIDTDGKSQGRGAYLCKNLDCFKKCKKNHSLDKAFKSKIDPAVYDEIEKNFFT